MNTSNSWQFLQITFFSLEDCEVFPKIFEYHRKVIIISVLNVSLNLKYLKWLRKIFSHFPKNKELKKCLHQMIFSVKLIICVGKWWKSVRKWNIFLQCLGFFFLKTFQLLSSCKLVGIFIFLFYRPIGYFAELFCLGSRIIDLSQCGLLVQKKNALKLSEYWNFFFFIISNSYLFLAQI